MFGDFVRFCAEVCASGDGTAPAGGGEKVACPVVAPGGWLSVMGGEFGRLGRGLPFFSHRTILCL